jgi:hypothetical protein
VPSWRKAVCKANKQLYLQFVMYTKAYVRYVCKIYSYVSKWGRQNVEPVTFLQTGSGETENDEILLT